MAGKHVARRRAPTDSSDYIAMLQRILLGYGKRIAQDPHALVHLRDIETALHDAVNLGIYTATTLAEEPRSQADLAKILDVSPQAMSKRVRAGREVFQERLKDPRPVVRVADVRQARAAALKQAGMTDTTGSPRELEA